MIQWDNFPWLFISIVFLCYFIYVASVLWAYRIHKKYRRDVELGIIDED